MEWLGTRTFRKELKANGSGTSKIKPNGLHTI